MKSLLYKDNSLNVFLESEEELRKLIHGEKLVSGITFYDESELQNKISLKLGSENQSLPEEEITKTPGDYRENKINELEIGLMGADILIDTGTVFETIKEEEKAYKISIYTTSVPENPYSDNYQNPY